MLILMKSMSCRFLRHLARALPRGMVKPTKYEPSHQLEENVTAMNRWNDASDRRTAYSPRREQGLDRWVERTRLYLRSRTVDHWLMFVAGLVIGALVA